MNPSTAAATPALRIEANRSKVCRPPGSSAQTTGRCDAARSELAKAAIARRNHRIPGAMDEHDWRRVRSSVVRRGGREGAAWCRPVVAIQADRPATEVSTSSKPGWNRSSLPVRAHIIAMCAPAEPPTTRTAEGAMS